MTHANLPVGDRATAVVVVHEILGLNRHIARVAAEFSRYDCDVFTPDFLPPDSPLRRGGAPVPEETAYHDFMSKVGVDGMAAALTRYCADLRSRYQRVVCAGFSVGATSAWIASGSGTIDAAVCLYGSRIRDHPELVPQCPCLLIFAAREPNVDIAALARRLDGRPRVSTEIYECGHGFCNPDHPNHAPAARRMALESAARFLNLTPGSEAS